DPAQRELGLCSSRLLVVHQLRDVHVGQRVARDDDEGVVEPVGEALDAPGRAQQLVFPLQVDAHGVHPGLFTVGSQERVRQVVDVDVDLVDAVASEQVEDVLDYGGVHHG